MAASNFEYIKIILLTNVYAPTKLLGRCQLWAHNRYVHSLGPFLPWIIVGDFNDIISLEEERGGVDRIDPSTTTFRENIDSLSLVDVRPCNGVFTWTNKRCGEGFISKRLDRYLVSSFWIGSSWLSILQILDWKGLDHWPIKFCACGRNIAKNPSFKF